jgi:hypothetical protein
VVVAVILGVAGVLGTVDDGDVAGMGVVPDPSGLPVGPGSATVAAPSVPPVSSPQPVSRANVAKRGSAVRAMDWYFMIVPSG